MPPGGSDPPASCRSGPRGSRSPGVVGLAGPGLLVFGWGFGWGRVPGTNQDRVVLKKVRLETISKLKPSSPLSKTMASQKEEVLLNSMTTSLGGRTVYHVPFANSLCSLSQMEPSQQAQDLHEFQ